MRPNLLRSDNGLCERDIYLLFNGNALEFRTEHGANVLFFFFIDLKYSFRGLPCMFF